MNVSSTGFQPVEADINFISLKNSPDEIKIYRDLPGT